MKKFLFVKALYPYIYPAYFLSLSDLRSKSVLTIHIEVDYKINAIQIKYVIKYFCSKVMKIFKDCE